MSDPNKDSILSKLSNHILWEVIVDSPNSVVITDTDGTILYVNHYFTSISEYTAEEAVGKNPRVLKSGHQTDNYYKQLWETIKANQVWSGRFCNKTKSGKIFWEDTTIYPIQLDNETYYIAIKKDITEQVLAETQLQDTQNTLQNMLDAVTESLFMVDESGRILAANKTVARRFGVPWKEFFHTNMRDLLPEHIYKSRREKIERVLASGKKLRDIDQRDDLHLENHYYPVNQNSGENRIVIFSRDITSEIQAKQALKETDELHRIILTSISDAVFIIDDEGYFKYICPNIQFIFGYHIEQVRAFETIDKLMPDFKINLEKFQHNSEISNIETKIKDSNGNNHTLLVNVKKVDTNNGTWLITCRDITDLVESDIALQATEKRFERAIQSAPFPIMLHAEGGEVLTINQMWSTITGYMLEDIPTIEDWTAKAYRDNRHLVKQQIEELYRSNVNTNEGIFEITTSTGHEVKWDFQSTPLGTLPDGRQIIMSIAVDVTEQLALQKQATQAHVYEAELKKERELSEFKERLMSVISHEFRTPLTIIQTSADLLSNYFDKLDSDKRNKHLARISEQIKAAVKLLDQTMQLRHAQSGRLEFNPSELDFVLFALSIFDKMSFTDNNHHPMEFECEFECLHTSFDANLFKHVIENLLSNAIKYTPDSQTVKMIVQKDDRDVIMKISDHGIGIPEADLVYLFQPYHRASNAKDINGTGLGLAIVKEYVELHGGSIICESKLNVGTTFTVRLPMKKHRLRAQ